VDLGSEPVRPSPSPVETKKKDTHPPAQVHAQIQAQLPWRELAIFAYLVLFAIIVAFGVENHKKHGHALKDSVW